MTAPRDALLVALYRASSASWRSAAFMAALAARDWRLRWLYLSHLFAVLTRRSGAN